MKYKQIIKFVTGVIILITISCGISENTSNWKVPEFLVGNWHYKQLISIRDKKDGEFIFIKSKDTVSMNLSIESNGNVTGTIGTATFENCIIKSNRGSFQRMLNLKTEYIITGKINGTIFPEDPFVQKEISFPFNFTDNQIEGGMVHHIDRGVFPILVGIKMKKN